jgi:ABC-type Mn2+/Zn2+ transport system permease subunit
MPLGVLTAPLEYAFMRNGLLEVVLLGTCCGLVGPFVVHRKLTFFGHALSHTMLPALVMGSLLGISTLLAAAVGGLVTLALVHQLRGRQQVGEDSAVGVVFVGLFALGVVLVGWFRIKSADLGAAMVGNLLGIGPTDLVVSGVLLLMLATLMWLVYRPLVLVAFDQLAARAQGLPLGGIDLLMLGAIATTTVVGVKAVGVILTVAVLVTPAASARQWSSSLLHNMALAAVFTWVAGSLGLYGGYYVRIAPAALVVLVLSAIFCLSLAFGPRRQRVAQPLALK